MEQILKLLDKPKIIAVVAETNQGKSNMLYGILDTLKEAYTTSVATYGLRCDLGEHKIHSLEELEAIRDTLIVIDEFETLFDIEDRKSRRAIENSLRLINHNNNIIILCGLPDNFKKFLSNKVNVFIFKTCRIGNFINGSRAKAVCLSYRGDELGATTLSLPLNEALIYTDEYIKTEIPYLEQYDTKRNNKQIVSKNVHIKVLHNGGKNLATNKVQKMVLKMGGTIAK